MSANGATKADLWRAIHQKNEEIARLSAALEAALRVPTLQQPLFYSFNLNWRVAVKLTTKGREILRTHWAQYVRRPGENPADRVGVDGWYETQLWDLMQVFGPFIGMGITLPFETEIRLYPDPWASAPKPPERASALAVDPSRSTPHTPTDA